MYKSIVSILLLSLIFGCSTTKKINVPDVGMTVIDYGADRRGSYLLKTKDGRRNEWKLNDRLSFSADGFPKKAERDNKSVQRLAEKLRFSIPSLWSATADARR